MTLTWSHAVLNVRDLGTMLDFYTTVLGFEVTDRGQIRNGVEIVFLSQDPHEHHQLAMVNSRADDERPNSLNHLAFRTLAFQDVKDLHGKLQAIDGINVGPLSHGNTLSIYFNDPEGNGIEVFWDTPWHVSQPQGAPWDLSMDQEQALEWVTENFSHEPTFELRDASHVSRQQTAESARCIELRHNRAP
ncbi:MAG TPA: VOC family protein [Ilumatobacteraceae bacterium]|nr:VOC family protein [Ilumatobacteraceae bacterium]